VKDPLGLHHAKHNTYLMVVNQRHCAMSSLFLSSLMCTSIEPCCTQDTIARLRRSIFPVIGQDTLVNNQMPKIMQSSLYQHVLLAHLSIPCSIEGLFPVGKPGIILLRFDLFYSPHDIWIVSTFKEPHASHMNPHHCSS